MLGLLSPCVLCTNYFRCTKLARKLCHTAILNGHHFGHFVVDSLFQIGRCSCIYWITEVEVLYESLEFGTREVLDMEDSLTLLI